MQLFIQYMIRLSICFTIMYLFYAIVLRRLTFYNHNRWYLFGYSLLCFFIPFLNIQSLSSSNTGIVYSNFVHMIPVITISKSSEMHATRAFDWYQIFIWIFFAGIIIMLLRLLMQLFSFRKLTATAKIISDDNAVKLYQVDKEIVPFSFGNSIFINQHSYDDEALKEILRHEFVHIKQKHTIDILWSEILCMLNWYNPFVWLIRKAIRENLEFIADNKVVQSGINKQQYQYLLLRVMGNNNFSFTNQFNFSSLKKRITMMNKLKSAKIHLLKFLFLIPLIGVLLVSFRDITKQKGTENTFVVSGLVVDAESYKPIANVHIHDEINNIDTITDKNGFYTYTVKGTLSSGYQHYLSFKKEGYQNFGFGISMIIDSGYKARNIISDIFLKSPKSKNDSIYSTSSSSCTKENATYEEVKKSLTEEIVFINNERLPSAASSLNKEHQKNNSSKTSKIYIINADSIKIASPKGDTLRLSGTFEIDSLSVPNNSKSIIPNNQDTSIKQVTTTEHAPTSNNEEFRKQNPQVDNWATRYGIKYDSNSPDRLIYTIYLKNSSKEEYDFSNQKDFKKFLKKYKSIPPETVYKFRPI